MIGILAAMLILTFTFGTVVAMGMPIGTAILGLTTALGAIGLLGHLIAVPSISHTVATMIGLAVGIDYSLFLVTRHRTQMQEGMEFHESIARAVGTAGTAVVFAGCTVVVALVSLVVAGIPLVSALGYTAAMAVATAVLAAVTLLPALMAVAGRHINSLALPLWLHPKEDPNQGGHLGALGGVRDTSSADPDRDRRAAAGAADRAGALAAAGAGEHRADRPLDHGAAGLRPDVGRLRARLQRAAAGGRRADPAGQGRSGGDRPGEPG